MSAGDHVTGSRCNRPLRYYDKPDRTDFFPVCWRPAGHPGKHLSRFAYLNELKRQAGFRQGHRSGKMTAADDKTRP